MKKIELENKTYFVGDYGIYLEIQNIKEFIDKDGIKRFLVEIKDKKKLKKLEEYYNTISSLEEVFEDIPEI